MFIHWISRARTRISDPSLIPQIEEELRHVFCTEQAAESVTVGDVFRGFRIDERAKLVLGVQVRYPKSFATHIVKLGQAEKVKADADGWESCLLDYNIASRLLLSVSGTELPEGRHAVIYQDAYQLFGVDPDHESPKTLEQITEWAIMDSKPDARSLERVIAQIYGELYRCLYHDAQEDFAKPIDFYHAQLTKNGDNSAWTRWVNQKEYRDLRRDAIWLTSAHCKPDAGQLPGYLDPIDYLRWCFATGTVPATLVGRSHGDLHGRNILAGISRGEVEQPVIFDYGDMARDNLPVWDFVKLETELKCRILPKLLGDSQARKSLSDKMPAPRKPALGEVQLLPEEARIANRVDRLEFAYQFERLLAMLTSEILNQHSAAHYRDEVERRITGHQNLDRALCLLLRIRQEAAYWLGHTMGRAKSWREEYGFSLAVYGLLTAKWDVDETHQEWALMSAGVALAQLSDQAEIIQSGNQKEIPAHLPAVAPASHLVALKWSHRLWKNGSAAAGAALLKEALEAYPQAVTLRAEYALCLADSGQLLAASQQIESLASLCRIFRDHETLARLGRIYKDSGDRAWEQDESKPDLASVIQSGHPAWQCYLQSFHKYQEAYQFSRNYFPGINAATLACLTGQTDLQLTLAGEIAHLCKQAPMGNPDDQFWTYATEGEAALLLGRSNDARTFYKAALSSPAAESPGYVQSLYNQLCRLCWALGAEAVKPVMDLLAEMGFLSKLSPGPFGDCGQGTGQ